MYVQSNPAETPHGLRISRLRDEIRQNLISFPSPLPVFRFEYRADVQWRLVELYFIHGWPLARLAARYGVTKNRVGQSIRHWVLRAISKGYLQEISTST